MIAAQSSSLRELLAHAGPSKGVEYAREAIASVASECTELKARLHMAALAIEVGHYDEAAKDLWREYLAKEIAAKWVARIGIGWHPDTSGEDYTPEMSAAEVAEYDTDMDRLFSAPGDPYAVALAAMVDAGLAPAEPCA